MRELSLRKGCPEEGRRKGGGVQKRGGDGHEKKGAWSQASKQSRGVAGALCK